MEAASAFVEVGGGTSGCTLEGYTGDAAGPAATACVRFRARQCLRSLKTVCACRRTRFSLLGRATLGVKATHQKLRLGAEPGALGHAALGVPPVMTGPHLTLRVRSRVMAATSGVSTPDGRLILSPALPLLGGRYRYVRSVGEGAFSQILVCDDTYSVDGENQRRDGCPSKVAIKVMNLKYTDIGAQELVMLRFLNKMGK